MNEQILDYFDSNCFNLARKYVEQNESTRDRFISYLLENDKIIEDDILDFCQELDDILDFDEFVNEQFDIACDEMGSIAYENWKDNKDNE